MFNSPSYTRRLGLGRGLGSQLDAIYELKRQMLFLERAHASARMGHFVLDPKRRTIEFSSWVRDNIGLNDMPIPIERLPEIVPQDERAQFAARVDAIIAAQDEFAFETNVTTAKGTVRTQRVSGIPVFENEAAKQGLIGFYGILQEITSEKKAQQDLVKARDKAQGELEARTNILAAVSHEIRTPLAGVLGIIDQLKRERSATERERALSLMEDSCQVLLDTLDAILQQAQLSQDIEQRQPKRFRPSAVAQRVAELFRPLARRKAIRIEVQTTSEKQAIGDPGRIQQMLANFVSNAVKFTQTGGVTLKVEEPGSPGQQWSFTVSDTGAGMDQSRIDTIFDPYDTSGKDSLGRNVGAGLGLSITRDLAQSMGGRIEVQSEVGRGSTFTVFLPLKEARDELADKQPKANRGFAFVAIQKATEQIQAEAIASKMGWTILDAETACDFDEYKQKRVLAICDAPSMAALPADLLEASERIIVLNQTADEVPASGPHTVLPEDKVIGLQAGNIARALPDVLEKVADACT